MNTATRKARVIRPPADDPRVLWPTSARGASADAKQSEASYHMDTRPKALGQVVSDVRLGYRRPSIG